MTQSELVGGEITRNMLSRIENGAANPSMDTVCYIAKRLNVSPGYLLADENDERIFRKHSEIVNIKKAFTNEDHRICRDMCMSAESCDDDEIQMILCECNLAIGIENFNNGNLRESCLFLDEAIEGCSRTIYRTDHIVASAGVYFRFMRLLSATLSSNVVDEGEINIYPAMTDVLCRYLQLFEVFENGGQPDEIDIMNIAHSDSPYVLHLLARKKMSAGEYAEAYEHLHAILLGEAAIPQPMLYFVFGDLEICCKEKEDFKGAYEFSMDKLELMQKLLS
jgi:transcriptional regulator with XRE-family HTH domain